MHSTFFKNNQESSLGGNSCIPGKNLQYHKCSHNNAFLFISKIVYVQRILHCEIDWSPQCHKSTSTQPKNTIRFVWLWSVLWPANRTVSFISFVQIQLQDTQTFSFYFFFIDNRKPILKREKYKHPQQKPGMRALHRATKEPKVTYYTQWMENIHLRMIGVFFFFLLTLLILELSS